MEIRRTKKSWTAEIGPAPKQHLKELSRISIVSIAIRIHPDLHILSSVFQHKMGNMYIYLWPLPKIIEWLLDSYREWTELIGVDLGRDRGCCLFGGRPRFRYGSQGTSVWKYIHTVLNASCIANTVKHTKKHWIGGISNELNIVSHFYIYGSFPYKW